MNNEVKIFTYDEAKSKTLEYFGGDELAAKVFIDKYALKDGDSNLLEDSPEMMHHRLAKEFARIEKVKFAEPMSEEEIFGYFDKFGKILPQGSPMSAIGNDYQVQSLGNCWTLPNPFDSYGGILYTDQQLVQLMKRRGGVGVCIDEIRPKGMPTKNSAKTTDGIAIFMERYSNTCREVAQLGRRGAELLGLSVHHPEIETFIKIKSDLKKVTGANISVKLTDEFMKAVKDDTDYEQRWPVRGEARVSQMVSARKIWDLLIENVWKSAEPGILFMDTIKKQGLSDVYKAVNPIYEDNITNPCVVGDTLVYVADGRGSVSIRELAEKGDDVPVFCLDFDGNVALSKMVNPRLTGEMKKILKVVLDNGQSVRVTENHKITNKDRIYVEAKDLKCGDILYSIIDNKDSTIINDRKVVSVEFEGLENVYNGTVDTYHNYFIGGFIENDQTSYINSKNCGEVPMGTDSCRLLVINLLSMVCEQFKDTSSFNFNELYKTAKVAQRLSDDMVDLELEAMDKILKKIKSDPEPDYIKKVEIDTWKMFKKSCEEGRRTGLGILGLGDALAALNIKYGSKESIAMTEKIYKTIAVASMHSSCLMAKELGAFPIYNPEIEQDLALLNRILDSSEEVKKLHDKNGRRNISLTTTSPTGSIALLTQTTSGIEPVFSLFYTRRRKINPDDKNMKVDFVDEMGDRWEENTVYHHCLKTWMEVTGKTDYKESPYFGATANEIDWIASVELQAAAQKWVSHSISKTCNLPSTATKELISEIYMKAYDTGCKGFTIYRDGSRSGVLIADDSEAVKKDLPLKTFLKKTQAPKRPSALPCEVHHIVFKSQKYYVAVGILEDNPYEVFVGLNYDSEGEVVIPKRVTLGKIVKRSRGNYDLIHVGAEEKEEIYHLTNGHSDDSADAMTRMISTALRHGADVSFIVHQLEKTKGGLVSFTKVLARTLKKYIQDGIKVTGVKCPQCAGENMERSSGCIICRDCGYSGCS